MIRGIHDTCNYENVNINAPPIILILYVYVCICMIFLRFRTLLIFQQDLFKTFKKLVIFDSYFS